MDQFCRDVRRLLEITGWSQAELARRIGTAAPGGSGQEIDRATVTNWLSKKTKPDGTARYTISDLLRRAIAGEFAETMKQPA